MHNIVATTLAIAGTAYAAVQGFDISHYQPNFDYNSAAASGARFGIVKCTEGISVVDEKFSDHYNGVTNAGMYRGAYHFARPQRSSGTDQANFFLNYGGGWTPDGITLPGMLDLENNPGSGGQCYGLSQASMVQWVSDFIETYGATTGRYPMIYTTNNWWRTCTGNTGAFNQKSPLVLARYSSSAGTVPGGWPYHTIWQNSANYAYGGDSDFFNGDENGLARLASG
ncbi:hypothetical protein AMS68_005328 [Peltaster fructicola]|uniref:N,O-diacetylmuramidase n=1 Tax=Peltaster fructicola TaxID=286661 RepID=A0A6H0XYS4_9PEZI|nr:hypothetical protein AMS68_005328 [Peltaster fructicola]